MSSSIRYATAQAIGGRREQQDRLFISPSMGVLGVFDGHQKEGALAAERAAESILADLISRYGGEPPVNLDHRLITEFTKASDQLINLEGGTTATIASISPVNQTTGKRVISVNNVGDSQAFLIDPNNPAINIKTARLTRVHTPSNPKEVERMAKLGVKTFEGWFNTLYIEHGEPKGVINSRALGYPEKSGIISRPYYKKVTVSTEQLLLLATDGLLGPSTTEDALEYTLFEYRKNRQIGAIAYDLVNEFSALTQDNATVILTYIPATN